MTFYPVFSHNLLFSHPFENPPINLFIFLSIYFHFGLLIIYSYILVNAVKYSFQRISCKCDWGCVGDWHVLPLSTNQDNEESLVDAWEVCLIHLLIFLELNQELLNNCVTIVVSGGLIFNNKKTLKIFPTFTVITPPSIYNFLDHFIYLQLVLFLS